MKKLFLVLLAGAMFVACGNKAAEEEAVVEETAVEEAVVEEPAQEEAVAEACQQSEQQSEQQCAQKCSQKCDQKCSKASQQQQETTIKEDVQASGKKVAKEAIKKSEAEAIKALNSKQ